MGREPSMRTWMRAASAVMITAALAAGPAHATPCTTGSVTCTLTGGGTNTQGETVSVNVIAFNPNLPGALGTLTVNGGPVMTITCMISSPPWPGNSLSDDWVEFFISAAVDPRDPSSLRQYLRIGHNVFNVPNNDYFDVQPAPVLGSACNADLLQAFPMTSGFFTVA